MIIVFVESSEKSGYLENNARNAVETFELVENVGKNRTYIQPMKQLMTKGAYFPSHGRKTTAYFGRLFRPLLENQAYQVICMMLLHKFYLNMAIANVLLPFRNQKFF